MQTIVDSDELNLQRTKKHQSFPSETVVLCPTKCKYIPGLESRQNL